MPITIEPVEGIPVAWNGTRSATIGEMTARIAELERVLREIAAWQNVEGVGGQAIRFARAVLGHCPTCGKESATAECASCEQWWRDNPPPAS